MIDKYYKIGIRLFSGFILLMCVSASALTEFDADSIVHVMKRLAKYRMGSSYSQIQNTWWGGAYMSGIMALYRTTKDSTYLKYATGWSQSHQWKPDDAPSASEIAQNYQTHGDHECPIQVYCEIYLLDPKPANDFMLAPTRNDFSLLFDQIRPDPVKLWWWCDAIFMTLPSIARYCKAVPADNRYLDTMDRYFWKASDALYEKNYHLWYRDKGYMFNPNGAVDWQHTVNGKPVFWGPGEAWVIGGLARMLEYMPSDYKNRGPFVRQFTEMCAAIKACQGGNPQYKGLWTTSMLDARNYPDPETSGTAFFCFAFAWGVRNGLLPDADYRASIDSAWKDLVRCVGADGRLLRCQKVDWMPHQSLGDYLNNSSPEGEGAFLLAGSEMYLRAIKVKNLSKDNQPRSGRPGFAMIGDRVRVWGSSGERPAFALINMLGQQVFKSAMYRDNQSPETFFQPLKLNNQPVSPGMYTGIFSSGTATVTGLAPRTECCRYAERCDQCLHR